MSIAGISQCPETFWTGKRSHMRWEKTWGFLCGVYLRSLWGRHSEKVAVSQPLASCHLSDGSGTGRIGLGAVPRAPKCSAAICQHSPRGASADHCLLDTCLRDCKKKIKMRELRHSIFPWKARDLICMNKWVCTGTGRYTKLPHMVMWHSSNEKYVLETALLPMGSVTMSCFLI